MNDRDDNDNQDNSTVGRPRRIGHMLHLLIVAALIAALVAVALDNRRDVPVGYVFDEVMAPVWIVLVAAALAGIVIGWLFRHRSRS